MKDELLEENNGAITLFDGNANIDSYFVQPVFHVDIKELAPLLLGYRTSELEEPLRTIFPEKQPGMHFMLE
jgi:hypothetical protein